MFPPNVMKVMMVIVVITKALRAFYSLKPGI